MSLTGMREAWHALMPETVAFYARAGGALAEGAPLGEGEPADLGPSLDRMLESSARLRQEAVPVLAEQPRGRPYEQVSELVLAAATIDAMLARDLAALAPEVAYFGGRDPLGEGLSPAAIQSEREELIALANATFEELPEVMGAAARPVDVSALIGDARDATAALVLLAEAPGNELVRGLVGAATLGAVPLLHVIDHIGMLDGITNAGAGIARPALAFLREHAAKIAALLPEMWVVEEVSSEISDRTSTRALLERVAASQHANDRVECWITDAAAPLDRDAADRLRADLAGLESGYRKQTKWIRKSARWLRRGVTPLAHLAVGALGPAGYLVMPAVFLTGAGYIGYSLSDRIDARDLGIANRIDGVVTLVEARVLH